MTAVRRAIAAGLLSACTTAIAGTGADACAQLPAGLVVGICADTCDTYQLTAGRLQAAGPANDVQGRLAWRAQQRPGSRASDRWRDLGIGPDRRVGDRKLDNPAAVAPQGILLAAAAAPAQDFDEYAPRHELAVLTLADHALRWTRHYDGRIQALAWSPDGQSLAVLQSAPVASPERGATDSVAGAFGWRVAHARAWLEIVRRDGEPLCQLPVYRDLKTPTHYLHWRTGAGD